MKCNFHPEDIRLVEIDRTEIEKFLRTVPRQQIFESLKRLIGQGRVAASMVQAGYHSLMEQASHG
jgi:hypothetical protein